MILKMKPWQKCSYPELESYKVFIGNWMADEDDLAEFKDYILIKCLEDGTKIVDEGRISQVEDTWIQLHLQLAVALGSIPILVRHDNVLRRVLSIERKFLINETSPKEWEFLEMTSLSQNKEEWLKASLSNINETFKTSLRKHFMQGNLDYLNEVNRRCEREANLVKRMRVLRGTIALLSTFINGDETSTIGEIAYVVDTTELTLSSLKLLIQRGRSQIVSDAILTTFKLFCETTFKTRLNCTVMANSSNSHPMSIEDTFSAFDALWI